MKKLLVLFVSLSFLLLGAGFIPWAHGAEYSFNPSKAKYPPKVKLSSQMATITPGYIWEHNKLVEKLLGIEAEYSTYASGAIQMQSFAMGKWDIGYLGVPPMMTAYDKGINTVVIAVGHQEGANVVGRKDKGFKTLKELNGDLKKAWVQLKGKKVGLPPQSSIQDAVTRTSLLEAGLDPGKDIELINVQAVPSLPDMLSQGQIDAFVGWPPFDVLALKRGDSMIVIPGSELGKPKWSGYPMNCLVASKELIEKYPDLVRDMVYVHTKVNAFIMAYPKEAAKMAAAVLKVREEEALEGYFLTPNFCPVITKNTIDSCLQFGETLVKSGYMFKKLTASEIFNSTFIEKVHPSACTDRVGTAKKDAALFELITGKKP